MPNSFFPNTIKRAIVTAMKFVLVPCILLFAALLEAAPQGLEWAELIPAKNYQRILSKDVGDIWSNCGKLREALATW